jgi:pilus assembly protein Flp/PilA
MVRSGFAAEVRRFAADETGATAIEYAMIASGVSIAIVGVVSTLGTSLKETFYDKIGSIFD